MLPSGLYACLAQHDHLKSSCPYFNLNSRSLQIFGIFGTMADRIREAGLPLERSTKDLATFERDRAMIESLVDKAVPIQVPSKRHCQPFQIEIALPAP